MIPSIQIQLHTSLASYLCADKVTMEVGLVVGSTLRNGTTTPVCNPYGTKEPLYSVWSGMKARCYNCNSDHYKFYGGKGISVCKAWLHYEPFRWWALEHGYSPGLSIDRIDSTKDYCPENCQWITLSENSRKARLEHPEGNYRFRYTNGKFCKALKTAHA